MTVYIIFKRKLGLTKYINAGFSPDAPLKSKEPLPRGVKNRLVDYFVLRV